MKTFKIILLVLLITGCSGTKSEKQLLEEKLDDLKFSLKIEPENPVHYIEMAEIYVQLEQYQQAIEASENALEIRPGMNDALYQKAIALRRTNNVSESNDLFRSILFSQSGEEWVEEIGQIIGSPYKITRFSDGIADNAFPQCSPVNGDIVFQSNRDRNWEIYISSGNKLERLTHHRDRDEGPVFFSHGSAIAFTSTRKDTVHVHVENLTREIFMLNLETKELTQITDSNADNWAPVFNKTGSLMAFLSDRNAPNDLPPSERNNDIFLLNLTTNNTNVVTRASGNKLLGDFGNQDEFLYYSSNKSIKYKIYRHDLANDKTFIYKLSSSEELGPKISNDGTRMAYFVKNNENYDIYMVDFTTQIPRRLTCHEGFDGYPVFSPDSQKIYFHSDREGNYQIYSISLNQPVQKSVLIENLNEEQS